jgi:hypothetical protein
MAAEATVFFYGLFMDPEALEARGLRPSNVREAFVDHYVLRLGERATLVPDRNGRVYGILMTLAHVEINELYSDAAVAAYKPEPVLAHPRGGTPEAALCFNLPSFTETAKPNPEYAAALQSVARKMRLPESYVASIGSR